MPNPRPLIALVTVALAALVLAACGSSSSSTSTAAATESTSSTSPTSGGGATVKIEADPSGALAFTKTQLSTTAGADTIEFDNPSSTGHNVEIDDANGNSVAATDTITGDTTTATADLKPGTYTYFCTIPGHRDAGMEGTLTVK